MKLFAAVFALVALVQLQPLHSARAAETPAPAPIFGFINPGPEREIEANFLKGPDARLAGEHLRILTQAPHIAGSPEDKATADYVAAKFREAGLETEIVEYKAWINYPLELSVDAVAPAGLKMHGPTPEHVEGDRFQDDPRVLPGFNGSSPSGDVEADIVYANYGRPEDFQKLADLKVDVRGKIVVVRYGQNFRGVKSFVAQEHGAAGVIIYSDPADDGWARGDKYPKGPWRPDAAVQRGSIGYMFQYPGDATTPGVASTPDLPASQRLKPEDAPAFPKIPTTPLSYGDARPLLEALGGPESPRDWQGALPFTYHVGPGPVRVKMHLKMDYQFRTIWDVIGKVRGSEQPNQWVCAGNHRDAWVYGAVDPNSGTAAMLESVHGIGELLKTGWRPKRTIVFGSWDAEEEGLMGSTEWVEQHANELSNAAAYFNMDVAVSGPRFGASAVPSLKAFVREATRAVPSPDGGSMYDVWQKAEHKAEMERAENPISGPGTNRTAPNAKVKEDLPVGDLGSGSDYTAFIQHLGVPSTDIGSSGPYGVYHSVFDNFQWFTTFADPEFKYEQEMARLFGIEVIRMADADILPYDYEEYGKEISVYLETAKKKAVVKFGNDEVTKSLDFAAAEAAAVRFAQAGEKLLALQKGEEHGSNVRIESAKLNLALRDAEHALLLPEGLPNRPWFKHAIYAPGQYTGYAAVVIPGVNEAVDKADLKTTQKQLAELTAALKRAGDALERGR